MLDHSVLKLPSPCDRAVLSERRSSRICTARFAYLLDLSCIERPHKAVLCWHGPGPVAVGGAGCEPWPCWQQQQGGERRKSNPFACTFASGMRQPHAASPAGRELLLWSAIITAANSLTAEGGRRGDFDHDLITSLRFRDRMRAASASDKQPMSLWSSSSWPSWQAHAPLPLAGVK